MSRSKCIQTIREAIRLLAAPGQVIELRVPHAGKFKTISGFYDDHDKLAAHIAGLNEDETLPGIYWTIQPLNPDILARQEKNTFNPYAQTTASDNDVLGYRWLPIDCDPVRVAGISATKEEKGAARQVVNAVLNHLATLGFKTIIAADSGNGYHLLVLIDLPNTKENRQLVERCIKTLSINFSTEGAKVDRKLFNPSRILKAYGTMARKGANVPERPWRLSKIKVAPTGEYVPASRELLVTLAAEAKVENAVVVKSEKSNEDTMEAFLGWSGWQHGERLDYDGGSKWQGTCAFNSEHRTPDAFVMVRADGKYCYSCSHDSCADNHWKEFRVLMEEQRGEQYQFIDHKQSRLSRIKVNAVNSADTSPEEAPDADQATNVTVPSFDRNVLYGKLGELADGLGVQLPYAYLSCLATFASKTREYNEYTKMNIRTTIYACLSGLSRSGKSEANRRARRAILESGGQKNLTEVVKGNFNSGEGLMQRLSMMKGGNALLSPDELSILLEKGEIQQSSLFPILNSLFTDNNYEMSTRGKEGTKAVNVRLNIIGGIPIDDISEFSACWGVKARLGLYNRFTLEYSDELPVKNIYEPKHDPWEVAYPKFPMPIWQEIMDWEQSLPSGSSLELGPFACRVALLLSMANGDTVVGQQAMNAGIAYAERQRQLQLIFQPGLCRNDDARCSLYVANSILRYLKPGEEANVREFSRRAHWERDEWSSRQIITLLESGSDLGRWHFESPRRQYPDDEGKKHNGRGVIRRFKHSVSP